MHETNEALSAYLDDEVDEAQRARIEVHLQMCTECSATRARLQGAAGATAALPEVTPTADESRAIRLAVIERAAKSRRFAPRAWALIGGVAVVAAGVAGYGLLNRGGPENVTQAGTAEGPALAFLSEREVKITVESLKEVKQGAGRYTVDDVGAKQSKALASFDTSADDEAAESTTTSRTTYGATSSEARTGEKQPASGIARAGPEADLGDCLRIVLSSQPYPMMPVLARAATFKDAPAWLLVYAWTASTDPNAPLDRIQVWLVDRTRCSPDAALYYASFKP